MIDPLTITYNIVKTALDPYLKTGFDKIHTRAALTRAIHRAYKDLPKKAADFSIEVDHLENHFAQGLY